VFNLILFGPPGAGKGTQSKKIAGKYGYKHISTGDILRSEISRDTVLGREVRTYIDRGALVPDQVLINILADVVEREHDTRGLIWDGFPRTIIQAEAFDRLLEEKGQKVNLVISLEVELQELVRRLVNRGIEDGRSDDSESIILQRQNIYRNTTQPLISFYRNQGKLASINGIQAVERVFEQICFRIEQNHI
jgi:adenylate kinase